MFEADLCCGMGGPYSQKNPAISAHLKRKLYNIQETGAPLVAMDCPACVLQTRGGFDKDGEPVRGRHTAELLVERLLWFENKVARCKYELRDRGSGIGDRV
ncbi:MAG: (Fe-S)-binding protein [Deltaproteobacteria bacterium]|nr:(Fe-S)-binding protein [Deltaproteobacteria bacterium]